MTTLEPHYTTAIQALWADIGLQEAWDRRREFQILDSAK